MSFLQLSTLSGPLARYDNKQFKLGNQIKYGAAVRAELEAQGAYSLKSVRPSALLSNVLTPIGKVKAVLVDDLDIFEGYNKAVLDEEGIPDYTLIASSIKAASALKSDLIDLQARAISSMNGDNCVSLLYNMLRLWAIKNNEKLNVGPDYTLYNDGHIVKKLADCTDPGAYFECNINDGFYGGVSLNSYEPNTNCDDSTSVIRFSNPSEGDLNVISICLQSWNSKSVYRVCHPSPALADNVFVNGANYNHMAHDTNVSANQVMMTLIKFVNENRLEGQFDLAYLMFCQVVLTPTPRAVEAFAWAGLEHTMQMPRFKTLRGMGLAPLSGQPAIMSPLRYTTFRNFVRTPTKIFTHAITYTEHVYAGMFELATASSLSLANTLAESSMLGLSLESPLVLDAQAINYRTGKEFSVPWSTTAGLVQFQGLLDETTSMVISRCRWLDGVDSGYEFVDNGDGTINIVTGLMKPVLYPCLSLGVNDNRFYINSKVVEAELVSAGIPGLLHTNSSDGMNKFMSIMRLMGYDVEAQDRLTGLRQRNWAANANGAVMPAFRPAVDGFGSYVTSVKAIKSRVNNWLKMPDIHDRLKVKATLTEIGYRVIIDGQLQPMTMAQPLPVTNFTPSEFKGTSTYLPINITNIKIDYNYSDFRFKMLPMETVPPISTLPLLGIPQSQQIGMEPEEPLPEELEDL